ncbi:MAG: hypothetical protein ACK4NT_07765, partial [Candidatus Omnitrophota bacterium]
IDIHDIGSLTLQDVQAQVDSVYITSKNDLYVNYVYDPSYIELTSNNGAIIDGNGNSLNIETNPGGQLILSAANGIGSGNALETEVSYLEAYNSDSGNIEIDNTGDLTITSSGVVNDGGDINITTSSSLYVEAEISVVDYGEINLTANGADGDIVIRDTIFSEDGDINLTAGRDILTDGAWGDGITAVQSYGEGDINLNAVRDIILGSEPSIYGNDYGYGDIYSDDGDINLTAGRDITVDYYTYVGADGVGNISFAAGNDINLITRVVGEKSWIYTDSGDIDLTAGNDILIDTLSEGVTSDTGNITFYAGNDINVGYVETDGNVVMTADSNITISSGTVISNGGSVDLTANSGSIYAIGPGPHIKALLTSYLTAPYGVVGTISGYPSAGYGPINV